ncbi:hypothetical protein O181_124871 [Austropuccinia psidii MF-1]|uniref:Uncharacterized protein n=1 Tax=Austropuccinia psidii MF-1 TaxID=1389203 RepID=A0A9Q3Q4I9_9BASI|nr:hypothetical protein [Austropuccinia psidii MF-1]
MTTKRGSQYFIQSDGDGFRGRIDSSKGKIKGNIPSGTESTQESALSQRQAPEMPMISEPELELIQTVLHSVQRQGLVNVASNTPRSDELLAHPPKSSSPRRRLWYTPMDGIHCHPSLKSKRSRSTTPKIGTQAKKKPQWLLPASPKSANLPKKGRRTRKRIGGNHIPQATGFQKSKKMPGTMSSTWPQL